MLWKAAGASLLLICATTAGAQPNEIGPCGTASKCPIELGPDAARLQESWRYTTDEQRAKMQSAIAQNTVNGVTDWKAAAQQYYGTIIKSFDAAQPDWSAMRRLAEAAVRERLIDPSSAQFEWPNGFLNGYWKPLLRKRVTGYVTCGYVNSKNRMGGYAGSTPFAVVIDHGQVVFLEIGTGGEYDVLAMQCQKTTSVLPSPQPGMLETDQSEPSVASVADELAKLADLRDRGVLTQEEFAQQKAILLNRGR